MKIRVYSILLLVIGLLDAGCSSREEKCAATIDLSSCFKDLANVESFAKTPLGKVAMISTYDRTGGNQDWGDLRNSDSDGLVTIANLTGPGCVKRIWMTSVPATEWCFFFDGEKEPRIRMTDRDLFGKVMPFLPPLCDIVSGGAYCYMPLPYKKSLRIAVAIPELKKDARPYYHINYETYPSGTAIKSFSLPLSDAEQSLLDDVQLTWGENRESYDAIVSASESKTDLLIPAGGSVELLNYNGGGELKSFIVALSGNKLSAYKRDRLLRELRLQIFWDENKNASVDVPLGDFFCNGVNNRDFVSMPLAHIGDDFICRFPMPFKESVRITLSNDGDAERMVKFAYDLANNPSDLEMNYFHARWVQSRSTGIPLRVLGAKGRGHYVGCYLSGRGMDGGWNILEGDETFLIDGESVPSLHGTGLEDYFNGAWYYYGIFNLPTHGLLEKAAMNTSQYRFHIGDPVKFDNSLNISFEFGDGNRSRGYMSATAYWYQDKPDSAGTVLPAVALRYPKLDQVELGAVMANLFELERAGLYKDAMNRSLYYAERIKDPSWSEMLTLRAVGYEEELYGFDKVKNKYKNIIAHTKIPEVKKQAKQMLWFNEADTNALLGAYLSADYKIYIDGRLVGTGAGPLGVRMLSVWPVVIAPGEHEIVVEAKPLMHNSLISIYLRTDEFDVVSDATWECSKIKPENWPNTKGVEWSYVVRSDIILPIMSAWQFIPNGFINMQSGKQLTRPWTGWDSPPATAYLRKKFIIE